MKILYRSAMEPAKLLEKNFISIDEIQLSNQVLNTLREDLNTSNQVMPSSARKLQEWHVGLLHR